MDYEKKYKDALERARQFCEHPLQEDSSNIVEYIFPELKESKDERIRKVLIELSKEVAQEQFFTNRGTNLQNVIAWLEKQGELVNSLTKGLDNAHERIDELIQKNNELCINLEKQGEKKPAWSEDDEKRLQSCINILKAKSLMGKVDTANTMWLKSLKERIGE